MQTFLPFESFTTSARVLDMRRLGKQRVEGYQILCCLLGVSSTGWKSHPAVKMWRGHEGALAVYVCVICAEWIERGYRDTIQEKVCTLIKEHDLKNVSMPSWIGQVQFHHSHQSNLLRKSPTHYSQYFSMADNIPYVWPL